MPTIPNPPPLAKGYNEGVNLALKNAPVFAGAEQGLRNQFDPRRIAEQQALQQKYGKTQEGQMVDSFRTLDPSYWYAREHYGKMVNDEMMQGSRLSPEEMAQTEQYVRRAQAARGNINGGAAATAEAYALGDRGQQLRERRLADMSQYLNGPNMGQLAAGAPPVMPDRSSAYMDPNAGWQGVNAANQAYQSRVGAQAANNNSNSGMWGSILGAVGNIAGGVLSAWSDRRMKTDVKKVGTGPKGVGIYEFAYKKSSPHFQPGARQTNARTGYSPRFRGVIAQDVENKIPGAVHTDPGSGLKAVDYQKVGMKMKRIS